MDRLQSFWKIRDAASMSAATILHINIVIYAAAFWLTSPLLPYLSKELGADRVTFGYLQSALEAAQIISSLMFGQIIDKFGPRNAMMLSQVGTGFAYLMLALSYDVPTLFLSRIPTVFMSCMLCAQGALPAFVDQQDRATAMGRLSVSYLLGMLVGSSSGGFISSKFGYASVGWLAALLSFVMTAVTALAMPKVQAEKSDTTDTKPKKLDATAAFKLCQRPQVRPLVVCITITGLAVSIYRSQFSVLLADHFHLDESAAGVTTSFGALVGVVCNTVIISYLRDNYSERSLLGGSVVGLATSLLIFTQCYSYYSLLAVLLPLSVCSTVLYTISGSALSNAVSVSEAGTAVSISHSVRSATGLIAPPIGGYLLTSIGFGSIGVAGASLAALAAAVFYQADMRHLDAKPNAKTE
eukprot:m.198211 g.198211  ORF g.198211 m.198211 type:complete len:411 (-) comp17037_c0_seq2:3499-4731(-)